jgi:acyl-CoA thioesterase FadM
LFRDQELLCVAESTLACIDRLGNVQRIPDALRPQPEGSQD